MELSQFLTPDRVFLLDRSVGKKEVLEILIKSLDNAGALAEVDKFRQEIRDREELMSTGIGLGIGIPHAKSTNVREPILAFAVTQTPVLDYGSLDGLPIQFVMMIAAPAGAQREYLQILAKVAFSLKSESRRKDLLAQTQSRKALDILLSL